MNLTPWDFNDAISSFKSFCIFTQRLSADFRERTQFFFARHGAPFGDPSRLDFFWRAGLDRPSLSLRHKRIMALF